MKIAKSQLSKRRGETPQNIDTSKSTTITRPSLHNRLSEQLRLPKPIIDLILETSYRDTPTTTRPLFAMGPSSEVPNEWIYEHQEIQEIIIYYEGLLKWGSQGPDQQTIVVNQEEAFLQLKEHLDSLVYNRQMKIANRTIVSDDSVFENPALAPIRQDELLRNNLLNRKLVPVPGLACIRCKIKEVSRQEAYTRSGDEGSVESYECQRCGHTWKHGG